MNTLLLPLSLSSFTLLFPHSSSTLKFPKLGLYSLNLPRNSQFQTLYNSSKSLSSVENQLSDAEEDEFDDDDDEAAEEYDEDSGDATEISGELEEEDELEIQDEELIASSWSTNDTKLQRVQKFCDEVREFGAGIIDVNELTSIYDFRVDKFQVRFSIKLSSVFTLLIDFTISELMTFRFNLADFFSINFTSEFCILLIDL